MKTNKEIKNGILENCIDSEGNINITGLDFSDFEGEILRGKGKVKGNLFQGHNEVDGDLYQGNNNIKGDLGQCNNKVKRKTYNDFKKHNKVMKGDSYQGGVKDKRFTKKIRRGENE